MSGDESPAKEPSRLSRILAAPKQWTMPTWATIALTCFLVTSIILCWGWFQREHQYVPWYHYMTWQRLLLTIALLVAVPSFFHRGLRLWLQGESSRFPEIERAWQAGVHALREAGIELGATPVFVCLGSNDELQERAIMNANATPLSVIGVPKGPAPLHWYGNSEAIYLFCTDASWLSVLNRLRREREEEQESSLSLSDSPQGFAALPSAGYRATPTSPPTAGRSGAPMGAAKQNHAEPASSARAPAPAAPTDYRGTMMLDQFVSESGPPTAKASAPAANIRGTMILDEPEEEPQSVGTAVADFESSPIAAAATQHHQPIIVPSRDSTLRLQRLQAVCQRLRNSRHPLCPANGILTLLPFELIHATADEIEELERAIKNDLAVLRDELNLRAPVTALVVGLEKDSGFRELVRRVGRDKSASQRFGGRYDLRAMAAADHLRDFSSHVCGAFEDWAYTLFRAKGALSRPGNTRLYSLLCKVRCVLKHKLGRLLANGVGFDARQSSGDEPHLFSGCYFAATGRTADRQAFARGVLEKLVAEQEQIEWTDSAITKERRCRQAFFAGVVVDAVLVATLAGLLWW
jgi:hypothetical protein